MRTPIETMIDKACGFDPNEAVVQQKSLGEERAEALTEVADNAVLWLKNTTWFCVNEEEVRLRISIKRLIDLGWEATNTVRESGEK